MSNFISGVGDDWERGYEEWRKRLLEHIKEHEKIANGDHYGTPPPPPPEEKPLCYVHSPETYVGFTDTFVYCRICDAKQKDGKWVK